MADVSPAKWHLAHTSWFFETFVLQRSDAGYRQFDASFAQLFNSYYNSVNQAFPRSRRGVLSRPSLDDVLRYRRHVDEHTLRVLSGGETDGHRDLVAVAEIGTHHEQQHQELLLADIKHVFSCNPAYPAYHQPQRKRGSAAAELPWLPFEEGVRWVGRRRSDFAYDNERPRHQAFVHAFEISQRLVTNRQFLEFINDGGYRRPELWLDDGWTTVQREGWQCPLYWLDIDGEPCQFTLGGRQSLRLDEPVCHISFFEADAFARWAGARLPTEFEWETAADHRDVDTQIAQANVVDSDELHPRVEADDEPQFFGNVWQWTASPYLGFPGYQPPAGPLGEYNGKFMCNQFVLRGGSCVTPKSHLRISYRNFLYPHQRWQFAGLRLAR